MTKNYKKIENGYLLNPVKRIIKTFVGNRNPFSGAAHVELALPYTVFWDAFSPNTNGHPFIGVAFTNKSIDSVKEAFSANMLYVPPIPHININCLSCLPESSRDDYCCRRLFNMIDKFFGSAFPRRIDCYGNNSVNLNNIANTSLRTYEKWEKLTKEKPLSFFLEQDWGIKPSSILYQKKWIGINDNEDMFTRCYEK